MMHFLIVLWAAIRPGHHCAWCYEPGDEHGSHSICRRHRRATADTGKEASAEGSSKAGTQRGASMKKTPATGAQQPLLDWNDLPIKGLDSPNPCVLAYGPGPEGATCGQCALIAGVQHARTYWKCRLRKNTNGPGSDHKRGWPACAKFEMRQGEIPVYYRK